MRLEDQYVRAIINRHRAAPKHFPQLERLIQAWAGKNLDSIALSGSHAKQTALRDSDVDFFLSLKPEMQWPACRHPSRAALLLLPTRVPKRLRPNPS
jgi:tRNA nucleotidyltransferase (CCA-adding enzyme)